MSVLHRILGQKVVKALTKVSYKKDRQKDSRIILRQETFPRRRLVASDHKEARLTVDEFNELLK